LTGAFRRDRSRLLEQAASISNALRLRAQWRLVAATACSSNSPRAVL